MRLMLVPGFTQTARSWDRVIDELPGSVEARALDVPTGLDFVETAHALGEAGGKGVYVGYSMGGRLCLQLALERPQLIERLVLISASPGIGDAAERAARGAADEEWADLLESQGADAFYDRWLAQPLFATLSPEAAALDARSRDVAVLAHQLRALGQGTVEPLWDRLGEISIRVCLTVGMLDERYVGIASAMRPRFPDAAVQVVQGAGHAVHLEQPHVVARIVAS